MRIAGLVVTIFVVVWGGAAHADLNRWSDFSCNYVDRLNFRTGDSHDHMVKHFRVPAYHIGVVTAYRQSGSGYQNYYFVDRASEANGRVSVSGVRSETSGRQRTSILILPPQSYAQSVQFVAHDASPRSTTTTVLVSCETVSLGDLAGQAIVTAGAQTLLEGLLGLNSGNDSTARDQVVDRALTYGMSALTRDNLGAVGIDIVINEALADWRANCGDGRFFCLAGQYFLTELIQGIFRDALYLPTH